MWHHIAIDLNHWNLYAEHGIQQLEQYLAKWAAFQGTHGQ